MPRFSRRSWFYSCLSSGVMSPIVLPLLGCGGSSSPEIAGAAVPSIAKDVRLTYRATPDFTSELSRAFEAGQTVTVVFGGSDRLAEGTPLLQFLATESGSRITKS